MASIAPRNRSKPAGVRKTGAGSRGGQAPRPEPKPKPSPKAKAPKVKPPAAAKKAAPVKAPKVAFRPGGKVAPAPANEGHAAARNPTADQPQSAAPPAAAPAATGAPIVPSSPALGNGGGAGQNHGSDGKFD